MHFDFFVDLWNWNILKCYILYHTVPMYCCTLRNAEIAGWFQSYLLRKMHELSSGRPSSRHVETSLANPGGLCTGAVNIRLVIRQLINDEWPVILLKVKKIIISSAWHPVEASTTLIEGPDHQLFQFALDNDVIQCNTSSHIKSTDFSDHLCPSHPDFDWLCILMVQLKWAAMALVIASFLAWTAGWMETEELEELDLSGLVSNMTTGSGAGRSTECIYSFPSPTVLRSSSLERIWLEQVVSACFLSTFHPRWDELRWLPWSSMILLYLICIFLWPWMPEELPSVFFCRWFPRTGALWSWTFWLKQRSLQSWGPSRKGRSFRTRTEMCHGVPFIHLYPSLSTLYGDLIEEGCDMLW